jgi:hypothetical protein
MRFQLLITNLLLVTLIQVIINIRVDLFGRQWYDIVVMGLVTVWGVLAGLNYAGSKDEDDG